METWPVALQQKLNTEGFGIKFGDPTISTDMDVGPAKKRARYTSAPDLYTCTILLEYDLYQDFEDFYKVTLNNGVTTFEFPHPMTLVNKEFRFMEPPDIRPISGNGGTVYVVSMKWELLP